MAEDEHLRICEICMVREAERVAATYVATGAGKMQWFECEKHGPDDYAQYELTPEQRAAAHRVKREPIGDWYRRVERWKERKERERRGDTEPAPDPHEAITVELHPFEALPGVTRFRVPPGFEGVTLVFVNSGDTPRDVFAFVTEDELFYGSLSEEHGAPGAADSLAGVADALARSGETGNALDSAGGNGVASSHGTEGLEAESEDENL